MAVFTPSYPLTFPTVVGVQTQRFSIVRTVAVSTSPFTGQDQIVQHEGEYWTTQIKFPPMLKVNASVVLAFLLQLRGRRGTFSIGDQDRKTIVTEDVTANGSGEADVKIEPALRQGIETIANDATVIYTNAKTIMRLDNNETGWDTDQVSKYGITLSATEAL